MTGIALKKPGATLRQHTYGYNAVSNVTSHTVGGITTSYGYDLADQLISESRPGYAASYTYDANGNRATRTVNGVTETHVSDAADKLMSISVGGNTVRSFTYDGRGRRKTDTYAGSTTTYSWDAESRLTSLARPGVTTSSFGYNGLDARVSKTDSTGTYGFKRNGAGVTDAVLSDGAATYTPGISERRAGSSKFLHSGMKNADAQSGASANVDSSRTYDAFGNLTGSVGTWSGPFGYAGGFGYQEDPDHGLRLLGHRYYDSSTGRFISKDPLGDGRNWYGYGAGEAAPTHFVDPDGLRLGSLLKGGKALWDFLKGLGTRKPPVGPAAKPGGTAKPTPTSSPPSTASPQAAPSPKQISPSPKKIEPKPGSSGGPTAGRPFTKAQKLKAKEDAPKDKDGNIICVFCLMGVAPGRAQVDHAIAKVLGGNTTIENTQVTCRHCNASKGKRRTPVNAPPGFDGVWRYGRQ